MAKRILTAVCVLTLTAVPAFTAGCQATAQKAAAPSAEQAATTPSPREKPAIGKICTTCHQPQPGTLRGNFENVAFKSASLQIKIDNVTEIVKFDPDTIKVVQEGEPADAEALRSIKKGHEVLISYTEQNGVKTAAEIVSKPPMKVPPEKRMTTAEIEKLVAMGPENGKYTLIDARPASKFHEGAIPTAVNIPFPAFDKMAGRLPKDKNSLIVYYCAGIT